MPSIPMVNLVLDVSFKAVRLVVYSQALRRKWAAEQAPHEQSSQRGWAKIGEDLPRCLFRERAWVASGTRSSSISSCSAPSSLALRSNTVGLGVLELAARTALPVVHVGLVRARARTCARVCVCVCLCLRVCVPVC